MRVRDSISYAFVPIVFVIIMYLHFYYSGLLDSILFISSVMILSLYALWQGLSRRRMLDIGVETIKKNLLGDYVTLEEAVNTVNRLRGTMMGLDRGSREDIEGLLERELANNPAFLGVWAAYEPDEFDGRDKTLGRMTSYYYRKDGKIASMALEDIDQEEFYNKPKETGTVEILDPFYYAIEGQDVLMTTVANPIKRKGRVIGVTGIDVLLKEAKTIYRELISFKSKYNEYHAHELIGLLVEKRHDLQLLGYAIDAGKKNQKEMIALLSIAATSLTKTSGQLADRNHDLSQRVIEQASSLEEIAATIEELVSTISQNAKNAIIAKDLSSELENKAKEGGVVVQESISAINEIHVSSEKIEEIITTINDIAFQTNLLALNAAIEAARAGDHGRGFAVVAGEVRNLAQLSGNAAKEIGHLIKDTMEKVTHGTTLANQSGESLEMILDSINEVGKFIQEIALASEEQRLGAEQISAAVEELDTMTQQNSGLVEQTVLVADNMSGQAKELLSTMEKYR